MMRLCFSALLLLGCADDGLVAADAGVDAGQCSPTGQGACNIDFPCFNHSVCDGNRVQMCHSTYYNGASPECSAVLGGSCQCCYGGSCGLGSVVSCPAGTVCRERRDSASGVSAECQSADGGSGWGAPPDAGTTCWGR